MSFAFTIVALVLVLAIAWRFLGSYMAAVFEDQVKWLAFVERPLYRVIGVDAENETHYLKCPPTGSGASSATRAATSCRATRRLPARAAGRLRRGLSRQVAGREYQLSQM